MLQKRNYYAGGGDFLPDHLQRARPRRHLDVEPEEEKEDIRNQGPGIRQSHDTMEDDGWNHSTGGDTENVDNGGIHGVIIDDGSFYGLGPQDNPCHTSHTL